VRSNWLEEGDDIVGDPSQLTATTTTCAMHAPTTCSACVILTTRISVINQLLLQLD